MRDSYEALRQEVENHLRAQGFVLQDGRVLTVAARNKEEVRALHRAAAATRRAEAEKALRPYEDLFVASLASGDRLNPEKVKPSLVPVRRRTFDSLLWRWCTVHWSVPVSAGYGRRMRYLVRDRGNDGKVVGVIGLADPVYAMRCRDEWIGWTAGRRRDRLTCIMDAFALGAVPPYSEILGGKLVSLLALSATVRRNFAARYRHATTTIRSRDPNAQLALITTTSALGRSSMYNRVRFRDGELAWVPLGFTRGSGDFHLSGPLYDRLRNFVQAEAHGAPNSRHSRWGGTGFRNRRAALTLALDLLGFDGRLLRTHGIERQVFAGRLMRNAPDWLSGDSCKPAWITPSVSSVAAWWAERWAIPRARRDDSWKAFDPDQWRIWSAGLGVEYLSSTASPSVLFGGEVSADVG